MARWFRDQGITTLGVCFLHSYANPAHEERMREVLAEEHPDAVVSLSSEVLREYREYERAMTTLVDAAVKPRLSAYVTNIKSRLGSLDDRTIPFYVMKSNGGVLSADEVVHQPITTVLSGPAAGALGAALIAKVAGFDKVLTSDGGGTSTDVSVVIDGEPTLTTEGTVGAFPSKIPMIDVVTVGAGGGSIAWLSPEGTLKVGPQSAGADPGPLCYAKGGADVTITDAHVFLGRIPPHLLGGEIPLDVEAARRGIEALAAKLGFTPEACASRGAGDLGVEPGQRAAPGHRQARPRRPRLHADHLRRLGLAVAVPPDGRARHPDRAGAAEPGQRLRLRPAHRRRQERLRPHPRRARRDARAGAPSPTIYDALTDQARAALTHEGFADADHQFVRTADLRYFGQAFEVRVAMPEDAVDHDVLTAVAGRFHAEHRALYGYDFAHDPSQQVEWVNLRVSGHRPDPAPGDPARSRPGRGGRLRPSRTGDARPVCFDPEAGYVDTPVLWRPDLAPGAVVTGPAIIEEFGSTVPLHPGFTARIDDYLNIIVTREEA